MESRDPKGGPPPTKRVRYTGNDKTIQDLQDRLVAARTAVVYETKNEDATRKRIQDEARAAAIKAAKEKKAADLRVTEARCELRAAETELSLMGSGITDKVFVTDCPPQANFEPADERGCVGINAVMIECRRKVSLSWVFGRGEKCDDSVGGGVLCDPTDHDADSSIWVSDALLDVVSREDVLKLTKATVKELGDRYCLETLPYAKELTKDDVWRVIDSDETEEDDFQTVVTRFAHHEEHITFHIPFEVLLPFFVADEDVDVPHSMTMDAVRRLDPQLLRKEPLDNKIDAPV